MENTTLFYVFIGITLVLIWGYFHGRRKNNIIAQNAIKRLAELTNPVDKKITNIGGLVGYHIYFDFNQSSPIEYIKGTLTLLARQSLLYFPFSLIIRKFDRFFITIKLKQNIVPAECHLFNKKFMQKHRNKIIGEDNFFIDEIDWEGKKYCYCYTNKMELKILKQLKQKIKNPDKLKEISIYPEGNLIEVLLVPTININYVILEPVLNIVIGYST